MCRTIRHLPFALAAAALTACGSGESTGSGEPDVSETRLVAVATLEPGGQRLENYVEWAVFPGFVPEGSETPDFSDAGTPYDTPQLDVPLSPGHYRVEAEAGPLESTVDIEIAEGERLEISVPIEGDLLVVDPVGETGVSGQLVRPGGRTTSFGSSAGAHILSVEPGEHQLTLNRGATTVSQTVEIGDTRLTLLEPDLSVGTLRSRFDFAGADPDFGLEWTIRHWNSDEGKVGDPVAREFGADFELKLPPGDYWVRGLASGLLRGSETVTVRADETSELTLSIPYTSLQPSLSDESGTEITDGFYWWLLDSENLDEKPWEVKKPGEEFLMAIEDDIRFVLAARDNESGEFVAMSDPLDLTAGEPMQVELVRE